MITPESLNFVYNVKIEFICSNNYKSKLVFKNQQFRDLMMVRFLSEEGKYTELHQLLIATCLNALSDEVIVHHLSPIDEFTITFRDEEGYKHIIEL